MTDCNHREQDQVAAFNQAAAKPETSSPSDWPFTISRDEERLQIAAGRERPEVEIADQVRWVARNMDDQDACPANAPDNAAWSMLKWAIAQPEKFYMHQRAVLSKGDEPESPDGASAEDEEDLAKMFSLVDAFGCWRQAEKREEAGTDPPSE